MRDRRTSSQSGFSLIELLVVILIIGILAAIAIPAFLNQRSKADDAQAKTIVRNAQVAIETYATNNSGSYSGASLAALTSIEPSLGSANGSDAYFSSVSAPDASDYTLVAVNPVTGDDYTVVDSAGAITRLCSAAGHGDCPASGTW